MNAQRSAVRSIAWLDDLMILTMNFFSKFFSQRTALRCRIDELLMRLSICRNQIVARRNPKRIDDKILPPILE